MKLVLKLCLRSSLKRFLIPSIIPVPPTTGSNPCAQPMRAGEGTATLRRWFYNPLSRSCASFTYRGLKGNQNNFLTQQDCDRACYGRYIFIPLRKSVLLLASD